MNEIDLDDQLDFHMDFSEGLKDDEIDNLLSSLMEVLQANHLRVDNLSFEFHLEGTIYFERSNMIFEEVRQLLFDFAQKHDDVLEELRVAAEVVWDNKNSNEGE